MKIQAMGSRQKTVDNVQVPAQLLRRTRLARIISSRCNPAGELPSRVFKPAHIITLPAMQADRDSRETRKRFLRIYPKCRIALFGKAVGIVDIRFGYGHSCL